MDFTLMYFYIGILYAMLLAGLVYFICQIVKDIKGKKNQNDIQNNQELSSESVSQEVACSTFDDKRYVAVDDNTIVMKKSEFVSFDDNFKKLDYAQKQYVSEIIGYALKKSNKSKKLKNEKGITVSIGKYKIVKIVIRKGAVVAKLIVPNVELASYSNNAGVSFREKPIDIIVDSEEKKQYVCELIDLSYDNIMQIKEDKKKARREKKLSQTKA